MPDRPGLRFDTMLYTGYVVPPFYDFVPLGKLVAWGISRQEALDRMRDALQEIEVGGIKSNIALHRSLIKDADVVASKVHTGWLEDWLEKNSDRFRSPIGYQ